MSGRKRKFEQMSSVDVFTAYLHYRLRHRTASEEQDLVRKLIHEYRLASDVDIDAEFARQQLRRVAHLPASELHEYPNEYMVCELTYEVDYDRDFYKFCQMRLREMSEQELFRLAELLISKPEFQEGFEVDTIAEAVTFLKSMSEYFDTDYEMQFFEAVFTRQFANWLVNH